MLARQRQKSPLGMDGVGLGGFSGHSAVHHQEGFQHNMDFLNELHSHLFHGVRTRPFVADSFGDVGASNLGQDRGYFRHHSTHMAKQPT